MKKAIKLVIRAISRSAKVLYWAMLNLGYRLGLYSPYRIPIVINNFNRLTYLCELIESLERCGLTNIVILDNQSTYQPLLEYYATCSYPVIRLDQNYGHLALWKSGLYHRYKWNYFVYTDPDVVPINDCPKDFIVYFKNLIDSNYRIDKMGFGLRIDDLPDAFSLKEKVIAYESRYWTNKTARGVYDAPIDTTLALYKPLSGLRQGEVYTLHAWRSDFPYMAKHLPWYVDSSRLSEEEQYYLRTCNASSTIGKQGSNDEVY